MNLTPDPTEDARRWLLWAAYSRCTFTLGLAVNKIKKAANACPTAVLTPEIEDLRQQARAVIEVFKSGGEE